MLLCYVTDRHRLAPAKVNDPLKFLLQKIEAFVTAGVDWVQIREKDLSARDLAYITQQALQSVTKRAAVDNTVRILVNDRLDVALSEGAGGVHLSENSISLRDARGLVERSANIKPRDFLIGASCHSLQGAMAAAESRADYVFFGPVFATPSKAGLGAPQGLDRLAGVCGKVPIPVIAIGGISLENAASCIAAGAAGIAAIRLFQDAPDPESCVAALRRALSNNSSPTRKSR